MTLSAVTALSDTFRAHIDNVRMWTRDRAELNLLTRGEESSDRQIAWSTLFFLSDFNATPHRTNYSIEDLYGMGLQALSIQGTTIALMKSVMILYARNHIPFSDGGLSVNLNDKAPLLLSMLNFIESAYEQNKRLIKLSLNVQQLLEVDSTGLFSDYSALSWGYGF